MRRAFHLVLAVLLVGPLVFVSFRSAQTVLLQYERISSSRPVEGVIERASAERERVPVLGFVEIERTRVAGVYRYEVDGKTYVGDRIYPVDEGWLGLLPDPRKVASDLAPGAVKVYVDADDPREAFLLPVYQFEPILGALLFPLLGGLVLIFGLGAFHGKRLRKGIFRALTVRAWTWALWAGVWYAWGGLLFGHWFASVPVVAVLPIGAAAGYAAAGLIFVRFCLQASRNTALLDPAFISWVPESPVLGRPITVYIEQDARRALAIDEYEVGLTLTEIGGSHGERAHTRYEDWRPVVTRTPVAEGEELDLAATFPIPEDQPPSSRGDESDARYHTWRIEINVSSGGRLVYRTSESLRIGGTRKKKKSRRLRQLTDSGSSLR